jgi:hypothetical protein
MNELEKIATLLKKRRQIDEEISKIIGRPSLPGHIGEFIASRVFNIRLETSATAKGIDGAFAEGFLKGKTVNIKMYGKQEGILDITLQNLADYYIVLTGPASPPMNSRGASRPIVISHVYLFEMAGLVNTLRKRGIKIGVATSVAKSYWKEAEIYPNQANKRLELTKEQIRLLKLVSTQQRD